ncbi:MAG: hypothetical protein H6Q59_1376 [Firmicutes bacterium]|nr:hypothetical protein [Bacillota bacterium]
MSILLIITGVILILGGTLSITKKWMWIQQGYFKRPVRVNEYMRYMGIVDIILGLFWITFGLINYGKHVSDGLVFLSLFIYVVLKVYGEIKYRINQAH